jgi:hypothetical protein
VVVVPVLLLPEETWQGVEVLIEMKVEVLIEMKVEVEVVAVVSCHSYFGYSFYFIFDLLIFSCNNMHP